MVHPVSVKIPGFSLTPDYIDEPEEHELLRHVDAGSWETEWRRRIQQYGLGYASEHGGKPNWIRGFPKWLLPLAERVAADAAFERFPENCVINEYIPPLGIGPHKDYPAFGPTIACVSLGSDIVIDFTDPARGRRVPVFIPARSFWVITGEARSVWMHGIAPRLSDVVSGVRHVRHRRVSITFRTAKERAP
ncbi:MAG: 2OG-Fe(II) oxygenase [Verrucomicrobiales bacterium]|nr:2OG-Fe(II) oxygenase [Verrucomicrobiales bacterium]